MLVADYVSIRGGTGSEFGRVPLLLGRIRVVAGSGYLMCDVTLLLFFTFSVISPLLL